MYNLSSIAFKLIIHHYGCAELAHRLWAQSKCRLCYSGEENKYELWEVKFIGYLRTLKLHTVITAEVPDADKNAEVFAGLVQVLDDTSLSLIIRDAKDKGKEALKILREHYIGASKPRIISLYIY